jgi:hypothetical protein
LPKSFGARDTGSIAVVGDNAGQRIEMEVTFPSRGRSLKKRRGSLVAEPRWRLGVVGKIERQAVGV